MAKHEVSIVYVCDGEECGGDICSTECNHTTDINYALHKDNLERCLFKPVLDEGNNIVGFIEVDF